MRKWIIALVLLVVFATTAYATPFYSIKRANITTSSVTLTFGLDASTILIKADSANTADLCVNWTGATAVCPSANTAGNFLLSAGEVFVLDMRGARMNDISVIAASGTQTFSVLALK